MNEMSFDLDKACPLSRKMKKVLRLLEQGHIITCNGGTTEFRFKDKHFELRFLDCTGEWSPIHPEDIQEEIINVLSAQNYMIDQKARFPLIVTVKFVWHDFCVGFRWNRKDKMLYFCPIPTMVFYISLKRLAIQ
jgi:hypothetical protein